MKVFFLGGWIPNNPFKLCFPELQMIVIHAFTFSIELGRDDTENALLLIPICFVASLRALRILQGRQCKSDYLAVKEGRFCKMGRPYSRTANSWPHAPSVATSTCPPFQIGRQYQSCLPCQLIIFQWLLANWKEHNLQTNYYCKWMQSSSGTTFAPHW